MDGDDSRLSRINTQWSLVRQAHALTGDGARTAQTQLVGRYEGAIRRYLRGALHDADAAEEVFQEFALNLVRGAFRNADPEQGRFRHFLKTCLLHLVVDYQRRQKRLSVERPLAWDPSRPCPDADDSAAEHQAFTRSWREDLLTRCWDELERIERSAGKEHYSVLRFRLDHPDMHSPELARHLSVRLCRAVTPGGVRVLIHRAREVFAELLLDAVLDSLAAPSLDEAEQELIELNLLVYCRSALEQRRAAAALPGRSPDGVVAACGRERAYVGG